jgi:uncharacterized protein (DUF608 family)
MKNDLVPAYQLGGDFIARLNALPAVLRPYRAPATLDTDRRLNANAPRSGTIKVVRRDARNTAFGRRMGWTCSTPSADFILAAIYLYAGERKQVRISLIAVMTT